MYLLKPTILLSLLIITISTYCGLPSLEDQQTQQKTNSYASRPKNYSPVAIWGFGLGYWASYYTWQKASELLCNAQTAPMIQTVKNGLGTCLAPCTLGYVAHWAITNKTAPEDKLLVVSLISGFGLASGIIAHRAYLTKKRN